MANTAHEAPSSVSDLDGRNRLSEPPAVAVSQDSRSESDEGDRFEDAPDTSSIRSRSLTTSGESIPGSKEIIDERDSPDNDSVVEDEDEDEDGRDKVMGNGMHSEGGDVPEAKPKSHDIKGELQNFKESIAEDNEKLEDRPSSSQSSRRISAASNMEIVNLDFDHNAAAPQPMQGAGSPDSHMNQPSTDPHAGIKGLPDKESATPPPPPAKTLSLGSITNALPSLSWGSSQSSNSQHSAKSPSVTPGVVPASVATPPSTQTPTPVPSAPAPSTRKLTSPFSWLSRASSSAPKEAPSPPRPVPRRNTTSSVTTMTSNPELMLGRLAEDKDAELSNYNPIRNSLKDRFQLLRKQSEVPTADREDEASGALAAGTGIKNTTLNLGDAVPANENENLSLKPPMSPVPPSPNPSLAPGTAVGVESGPSAMSEGTVDWDLWQAVVYEGPAAVARSSAEELNRAIATGIPSAIRGVIWQVLAESKNDDLEIVYKELVTRGTDKAKDRHSHSTTVSVASNGHLSIQSDQPVASSASSITSDSGGNGVSTPMSDKAMEAAAKAQAAITAERKRKEKEDAVTLQKLEKVIRRDMGTRTSYSKYAAAEGLQDGLFGVCKAYALFDEEVGYAQGMNFLVMPLLFNMPEEEAFCMLVRLMNHYGLRDLFVNEMPGLHMRLYQFERLLEDFEPALYCHLHRRHISPHLYATQWFLTLFAYRFPLQLVLRIYDLIFSEGLSAILRFGLVLMQKNASTLLAMHDMQQLTGFLKEKVFDVYIDKSPSAGSILENGFFGSSSSSLDKEVYHADQLVRDACEIKITPRVLKTYTAEWGERTRAEKERGAELESLRNSNASYAIRMRKLEERIEAVDHEQAALATEFVHTKVDNQEVRDENESLRGQVRELRNVIEKQPVELEQAWQAERDDLMKRNTNVHEENQRLEKELADLEEELVQTKLRYAELDSQHETLTRRWTDLKKQFA